MIIFLLIWSPSNRYTRKESNSPVVSVYVNLFKILKIQQISKRWKGKVVFSSNLPLGFWFDFSCIRAEQRHPKESVVPENKKGVGLDNDVIPILTCQKSSCFPKCQEDWLQLSQAGRDLRLKKEYLHFKFRDLFGLRQNKKDVRGDWVCYAPTWDTCDDAYQWDDDPWSFLW